MSLSQSRLSSRDPAYEARTEWHNQRVIEQPIVDYQNVEYEEPEVSNVRKVCAPSLFL